MASSTRQTLTHLNRNPPVETDLTELYKGIDNKDVKKILAHYKKGLSCIQIDLLQVMMESMFLAVHGKIDSKELCLFLGNIIKITKSDIPKEKAKVIYFCAQNYVDKLRDTHPEMYAELKKTHRGYRETQEAQEKQAVDDRDLNELTNCCWGALKNGYSYFAKKFQIVKEAVGYSEARSDVQVIDSSPKTVPKLNR